MVNVNQRFIRLAGVVLLALVNTTIAEAQQDQHALAEQLLQGNAAERSQALESASMLEPRQTGRELRDALITLLARENDVVANATTRHETVDQSEDPEFIAHLSRVVAALRDPSAIPALARAYYGGVTVMRALAEFGEQAVPAVVAVTADPNSHYDLANHGLTILRFMVEGSNVSPLSPATRGQIRGVAAQRLAGKQYFTTLWKAIDLAVTLNDPVLRRTVESLAKDRREVMSRGVEKPDLIDRTQRLAAQRLAGVAPAPRFR